MIIKERYFLYFDRTFIFRLASKIDKKRIKASVTDEIGLLNEFMHYNDLLEKCIVSDFNIKMHFKAFYYENKL